MMGNQHRSATSAPAQKREKEDSDKQRRIISSAVKPLKRSHWHKNERRNPYHLYFEDEDEVTASDDSFRCPSTFSSQESVLLSDNVYYPPRRRRQPPSQYRRSYEDGETPRLRRRTIIQRQSACQTEGRKLDGQVKRAKDVRRVYRPRLSTIALSSHPPKINYGNSMQQSRNPTSNSKGESTGYRIEEDQELVCPLCKLRLIIKEIGEQPLPYSDSDEDYDKNIYYKPKQYACHEHHDHDTWRHHENDHNKPCEQETHGPQHYSYPKKVDNDYYQNNNCDNRKKEYNNYDKDSDEDRLFQIDVNAYHGSKVAMSTNNNKFTPGTRSSNTTVQKCKVEFAKCHLDAGALATVHTKDAETDYDRNQKQASTTAKVKKSDKSTFVTTVNKAKKAQPNNYEYWKCPACDNCSPSCAVGFYNTDIYDYKPNYDNEFGDFSKCNYYQQYHEYYPFKRHNYTTTNTIDDNACKEDFEYDKFDENTSEDSVKPKDVSEQISNVINLTSSSDDGISIIPTKEVRMNQSDTKIKAIDATTDTNYKNYRSDLQENVLRQYNIPYEKRSPENDPYENDAADIAAQKPTVTENQTEILKSNIMENTNENLTFVMKPPTALQTNINTKTPNVSQVVENQAKDTKPRPNESEIKQSVLNKNLSSCLVLDRNSKKKHSKSVLWNDDVIVETSISKSLDREPSIMGSLCDKCKTYLLQKQQTTQINERKKKKLPVQQQYEKEKPATKNIPFSDKCHSKTAIEKDSCLKLKEIPQMPSFSLQRTLRFNDEPSYIENSVSYYGCENSYDDNDDLKNNCNRDEHDMNNESIEAERDLSSLNQCSSANNDLEDKPCNSPDEKVIESLINDILPMPRKNLPFKEGFIIVKDAATLTSKSYPRFKSLHLEITPKTSELHLTKYQRLKSFQKLPNKHCQTETELKTHKNTGDFKCIEDKLEKFDELHRQEKTSNKCKLLFVKQEQKNPSKHITLLASSKSSEFKSGSSCYRSKPTRKHFSMNKRSPPVIYAAVHPKRIAGKVKKDSIGTLSLLASSSENAKELSGLDHLSKKTRSFLFGLARLGEQYQTYRTELSVQTSTVVLQNAISVKNVPTARTDTKTTSTHSLKIKSNSLDKIMSKSDSLMRGCKDESAKSPLFRNEICMRLNTETVNNYSHPKKKLDKSLSETSKIEEEINVVSLISDTGLKTFLREKKRKSNIRELNTCHNDAERLRRIKRHIFHKNLVTPLYACNKIFEPTKMRTKFPYKPSMCTIEYVKYGDTIIKKDAKTQVATHVGDASCQCCLNNVGAVHTHKKEITDINYRTATSKLTKTRLIAEIIPESKKYFIRVEKKNKYARHKPETPVLEAVLAQERDICSKEVINDFYRAEDSKSKSDLRNRTSGGGKDKVTRIMRQDRTLTKYNCEGDFVKPVFSCDRDKKAQRPMLQSDRITNDVSILFRAKFLDGQKKLLETRNTLKLKRPRFAQENGPYGRTCCCNFQCNRLGRRHVPPLRGCSQRGRRHCAGDTLLRIRKSQLFSQMNNPLVYWSTGKGSKKKTKKISSSCETPESSSNTLPLTGCKHGEESKLKKNEDLNENNYKNASNVCKRERRFAKNDDSLLSRSSRQPTKRLKKYLIKMRKAMSQSNKLNKVILACTSSCKPTDVYKQKPKSFSRQTCKENSDSVDLHNNQNYFGIIGMKANRKKSIHKPLNVKANSSSSSCNETWLSSSLLSRASNGLFVSQTESTQFFIPQRQVISNIALGGEIIQPPNQEEIQYGASDSIHEAAVLLKQDTELKSPQSFDKRTVECQTSLSNRTGVSNETSKRDDMQVKHECMVQCQTSFSHRSSLDKEPSKKDDLKIVQVHCQTSFSHRTVIDERPSRNDDLKIEQDQTSIQTMTGASKEPIKEDTLKSEPERLAKESSQALPKPRREKGILDLLNKGDCRRYSHDAARRSASSCSKEDSTYEIGCLMVRKTTPESSKEWVSESSTDSSTNVSSGTETDSDSSSCPPEVQSEHQVSSETRRESTASTSDASDVSEITETSASDSIHGPSRKGAAVESVSPKEDASKKLNLKDLPDTSCISDDSDIESSSIALDSGPQPEGLKGSSVTDSCSSISDISDHHKPESSYSESCEKVIIPSIYSADSKSVSPDQGIVVKPVLVIKTACPPNKINAEAVQGSLMDCPEMVTDTIISRGNLNCNNYPTTESSESVGTSNCALPLDSKDDPPSKLKVLSKMFHPKKNSCPCHTYFKQPRSLVTNSKSPLDSILSKWFPCKCNDQSALSSKKTGQMTSTPTYPCS